MKLSENRFGVRTISGHRAASWKAWAPSEDASDFYVSCRALDGEIKASFHQSGRWHVSFTKDFHENAFDVESKPPTRFLDRWSRPSEVASGVTLALRVVVPWSAATTLVQREADNITWIAPAPEGYAVEFAVVLTTPECLVSTWPGKNSMNSQLVGSFPLFSGERVWVTWTIQPFAPPSLPLASGQFFRGKSERSLMGGNLRSLALGEHPDGSRILYDIPVEMNVSK